MFKNQIQFHSKKNSLKISLAIFPILAFLAFSNYAAAQDKVTAVESFDNVVVSPHIEVIFREGAQESVTIESITVPMEKMNILVKNNTLSLFLEGARVTTKTEKAYQDGYKTNKPIYKSTVVRAVVTYKKINSLDLRGEERFVFEDKMTADKLRLKIFGESQVYFNDVNLKNLQVSIYGESVLEMTKGTIEKQKFTAYGETKVNTSNIVNKETKLTAYGDGTFQLNVSEKLKITSYGEATIVYSGNANVNKGIVIGETEITRVNY